jgi:hypothetical protein
VGKAAKVTVGNVVPAFTADVPDDSSTCTTPTNVGSNVTFDATATDANGDTWKILVCKTAIATPATATACDGGSGNTWCTGNIVASNSPSSCNYSATTGDYESQVWHAYACDSVGCSADSNVASPFYVNREAGFTVIGSGSGTNPGAKVTFSATASDGDTGGTCTADEVQLYICDGADTSPSTPGCAGSTEICHSALTASNPSCEATNAVPIPTTHGADKDYYPYVFDTHGMAAGGSIQGVMAHYTVNDVAPTITSVSLHGGTLIVLNLKGSTTNVAAISTDVYDSNGFEDITGATAVIYLTSKTDACSANDKYCYQVATGNCVQSAGSGATCTYTCTAAFKYYADPTDTSSTWTADTWTAKMTATDGAPQSGSQTSSTVELQTNTALTVTETEINYETVAAGADTGANNETATVVNEGNSPIDTNLYGVDMTYLTNTIAVGQQHYKLTAFTYGTPPEGGTALLVSIGVDVDTETTKPTNDDVVSDVTYWGIGIPAGKAAGAYEGTNTFTVLIDADNWPGTP